MHDAAEILWEPTAVAVESSSLTAYTDWLRAERGVDVTTYPELWQWSVDDLEALWNSIFDYFRGAVRRGARSRPRLARDARRRVVPRRPR